MSETVPPVAAEPIAAPAAPPVSETPTAPSSAAPGPVVGTTPSGAGAEAPVPAADSPASAETPTEPAPAETPQSLLSKPPEEAKPAEEKPAEAKAEEKPAELPLPTYEPFTLPEGVKLDDEKLGAFTGLLGEYENRLGASPETHAAIQEMGQKMVDLYVAEQQEASQRWTRLQHDTWLRTRETWAAEVRDDPEIGGERQAEVLQRCGALLDRYAAEVGAEQAQKLRDNFTLTGNGDFVETIRFMNWAASRFVETSRVVAAGVPSAPMGGTRATRLYRNSLGVA